MHTTKVTVLQGMAVFGAISGEAMRFLLSRAGELSVAKGECFFSEGDEGTQMYVLERGRVELVKSWQGEERWLAEMGPGDCFGEMALMDFQPRSATARAVEDCFALEVTVSDLFALYEHDLEQFVLIQMNMGREVSRRLRVADEQLFRAVHGEDAPADRDTRYLT